MRTNIENAILATFLFANDTGDDMENVFTLDTSIFKSAFRKRVAEQINEVKDNAYGFLSYTIEEKVNGTTYEQDFIDMIGQASMTLLIAKKYHDKLVADDKMEELL
jgi:hypothetical protein